MENNKSFKDTVQNMTAKEILGAMISGLEKEHVAVDMESFGHVSRQQGKNVCFGCAATNAVCEISGVVFNEDTINEREKALGLTDKEGIDFLNDFECAIDCLRVGEVYFYNVAAKEENFAIMPISIGKLPQLGKFNWRENLPTWKEYYEQMEEKPLNTTTHE